MTVHPGWATDTCIPRRAASVCPAVPAAGESPAATGAEVPPRAEGRRAGFPSPTTPILRRRPLSIARDKAAALARVKPNVLIGHVAR